MNFSKLLSFVVASILVAPSLAVTITDASEVASKTYDYVIVGGIFSKHLLKRHLLTHARWNCRTRRGQSLNGESKRQRSCSRSWCQVYIQSELVIAHVLTSYCFQVMKGFSRSRFLS